MPSTVDPAQVEAPEAAAAEVDAEAEQAADVALAVATEAFDEHESFLEAGPAQLSRMQHGYTFVDGPSTAPTIVSIASTEKIWAAAVHGSDGVCHWIRTTSAGTVSYGTGLDCTGAAALDPSIQRASSPR
jgi:hypothetical protein